MHRRHLNVQAEQSREKQPSHPQAAEQLVHDSPSVCYKPFSRRLIGHTSRLWRQTHSGTTPGCFELSSTNVNYRGRVCLLSITGKPNPTRTRHARRAVFSHRRFALATSRQLARFIQQCIQLIYGPWKQLKMHLFFFFF